MSVKQLLYFSGLVPTVLGGNYFGQDRKIDDTLRRIGKKVFKVFTTNTKIMKALEKLYLMQLLENQLLNDVIEA
ncbi:hypothetical protein A6V39_03635 [Candidatus Mycoplasma haematobovis]|uniref:Uncharacterized protein n=1 Tax=Candidatus Mycoplasma haematobovis TaxID=432608 RepID=A0A1A9QCL3_9MOLU|nr:hypothetical protein [Candidatus Mycoplasma haematobovis]OAL09978.1 hypothetical protein A6V39_03635 [Candidatus Mycoplasma haematobovis]